MSETINFTDIETLEIIWDGERDPHDSYSGEWMRSAEDAETVTITAETVAYELFHVNRNRSDRGQDLHSTCTFRADMVDGATVEIEATR